MNAGPMLRNFNPVNMAAEVESFTTGSVFFCADKMHGNPEMNIPRRKRILIFFIF